VASFAEIKSWSEISQHFLLNNSTQRAFSLNRSKSPISRTVVRTLSERQRQRSVVSQRTVVHREFQVQID
jgi:hypothetical protein